MGGGTVMRIGVDDTDSPRGMCTTYLGFRLAGLLLRAGAEFLEYPRLVRLNPNVPWRTRGNGAVALVARVPDPGRAREIVEAEVRARAEVGAGANPAAVFCEGGAPAAMRELSRLALWRLVSRAHARRVAGRAGAAALVIGNGQGLVGAMSAIGYEFGDSTLELLAYRREENAGTPRRVSAASVRRMQEATRPRTFCSYDEASGRPLVSPRGPDPVLYGVRGDDARALLGASAMIRAGERPAGHMLYRTNQGTGDHLRNRLDPAALEPHSSGTVSGVVCGAPEVRRGGHAFFELASGGARAACAAYRESGLARAAALLAPGDAVEVGGGVRPAAGRHPRVLNAEFLRVGRLARAHRERNPRCGPCGKSMKSAGAGQGFRCARCGRKAASRVREPAPRALRPGLHLPPASAQRHLARPPERQGARSRIEFDASVPWYKSMS